MIGQIDVTAIGLLQIGAVHVALKDLLVKNYADAALTYDIEFFGETHVRTAQSYETKGKTYYIFGETEIAEQCFQEAKSIYTKWGYDEKAQDCEDMLKQINSE